MKAALILIASSSVLFFTGCTKEGPMGEPGNANVKVFVFEDQSFFHNQVTRVFEVTIELDEITKEILSNGFVTAYVAKANSENTLWTAVPGMFSPDIEQYAAEYFDVAYFEKTLIIYTKNDPEFLTMDVKVVVTAGN